MKLSYLNIFEQLHENQARLWRHWNDPVDLTVSSYSQLASITNDMGDQFTKQWMTVLNLFMPFSASRLKKSRTVSGGAALAAKTRHTAVVTGGVGGIGSEICKTLAKRGNQVIATYIVAEQDHAIKWQKDCYREGLEIGIIECDVTDFDVCKKMTGALEQQYGRIDILVNCAGITRDATLKKMDQEHWHSVLDTNLDSVFNVTRNVISGMVKRRYGRIINISSVNGHRGQFGQTNYAAAKSGMIGFTRSLARELADSGITVNTVSPGYVGTRMVEAIPEEIKNSIIAKIPVGRLGKPSEIGDAVAFLADQNSAYITGSDIPVNGGLFMG